MPVTSVSRSTVDKDLSSIDKKSSNHVEIRTVINEEGGVSRAEVEKSDTSSTNSKCRDGGVINIEAQVANFWRHTVERVSHRTSQQICSH